MYPGQEYPPADDEVAKHHRHRYKGDGEVHWKQVQAVNHVIAPRRVLQKRTAVDGDKEAMPDVNVLK